MERPCHHMDWYLPSHARNCAAQLGRPQDEKILDVAADSECPHSDSDRLLFVCINCGMGDPAPWVLGFSFTYFALHFFKWAALGFRVVSEI